jgi:hypothetical protein
MEVNGPLYSQGKSISINSLQEGECAKSQSGHGGEEKNSLPHTKN